MPVAMAIQFKEITMTFKDQILHLAETTLLTNRQIKDKLGCSMRTVQHYVGDTAERLQAKQGVINEKLPRIALFDLETAPMEIFVWGLYKQHPGPHQIIKESSLLSYSAKWLNEPDVIGEHVTTGEAHVREDYSILEGLWNVVDEADIIIAHNAKRFDVRVMNASFLKNGIGQPSPYQVVDTLTEARKHFKISSYKLDYLAKWLECQDRKMDTNFDLWRRCVNGDNSALDKMLKYNKQDVLVLEDVYMALRPWMKSHPNLGLFVEANNPICPNCGSLKLRYRGYYNTQVSRFRAFQCRGCGAIGRLRKSTVTKNARKNLAMSVAR